MLQWFRAVKYRQRGEKAAVQRGGTILSCRSSSSWRGAHSCDFPTTEAHPAAELTVLSRGKKPGLWPLHHFCDWWPRLVHWSRNTGGGQTWALTDHSVTNSVVWNCVSVLACVCVCFLYGGWSPYVQFRPHLWWWSVCSCVRVFLFCREKGGAFYLCKSAVCIFLNDGYLLCADNSVYVSVTQEPDWGHSARVSDSHADRLLCMLLTALGSEPSGQTSLTMFNNERVHVLSEFLRAWGLPFLQLCVARSTEYHSWQAKRNPQKFVIKSQKKSLKFWSCFHLTN